VSNTYGVIGVGSIAAAMVVGWCDGVADAPEIVLSPRSAERSADLAARFDTVRVAADNQAVVDAADVVVVCLLPGNAVEVLSGLRFRPGQAVVSAVAGVDVARLREVVAPASEVARSIPLPAVATRESVTPVHPAGQAVEELFARLGGSMVVADELAFESIAAASATVAAYFGYLGAIAGWLGDRGIPQDDARRYVAATFAALAGELGAPDPDFTALANAHATPGGLNEQFARDLGEAGVYDEVRIGLDGVLRRIAPN
jgi:pyrroline-5-carboxylate reductase